MSGIVTPDRVCATCQYWEQHDCEEVSELTHGYCHRFPPAIPIVGETIEDAQLVWYPTTFAFDWCGEHKTRP